VDPSGQDGFVRWMEALLGGTATTLIGAFMGRLMYHVGEVKRQKRRFFGREILWEAPIAVGMAIIGEGVASYLGMAQPVSTAVIAMLAYLGPRGAEVMLERLIRRG
jgi:hypothetical protein